jgi:hypothetical protein
VKSSCADLQPDLLDIGANEWSVYDDQKKSFDQIIQKGLEARQRSMSVATMRKNNRSMVIKQINPSNITQLMSK